MKEMMDRAEMLRTHAERLVECLLGATPCKRSKQRKTRCVAALAGVAIGLVFTAVAVVPWVRRNTQ